MAKVKVPKEVSDGITAVRDSGLTNMLARDVVARLADEMGYHETAQWVRTHPGEFAELIFHGAEMQEP